MIILIPLVLLSFSSSIYAQKKNNSIIEVIPEEAPKIEGRLFTHDGVPLSARYLVDTKIVVNSGQHYGFLRSDGSFTISGLQFGGSYVIEVSNPTYFYEAVRVDISGKGKIRARKVNYIQVTEIKAITYPLVFRPKSQFKYFHVRETWRITDLLMNPMVLMMVVPLLLVMVLPKLVNQEELQQTQKELQNMPNLQNSMQDMPELSEMMANWLGQPKPQQSSSQQSKTKKKNK